MSQIETTVAICHQNISTFVANHVIAQVYKESPPDENTRVSKRWGRECNSIGIYITRVAREA